MSKVNVFEVKAKFSEYLDRAIGGEHIMICRHNKPVAELRAVEQAQATPRPIGPVPGRPTFEVPPSFFEPMSSEELDSWDGRDGADPLPAAFPAPHHGSRVAETKTSYRPRRRRAKGGTS